MTSTMQAEVQAALRGAGPLTVDEIITRLPADVLSASKNPKAAVRNALTGNQAIQGAGHRRHVYLPTYVRGASVRCPVDLAAPNRRLLAVGKEVLALLWPESPWSGLGRSATVRLEGDDAVTVKSEHANRPGGAQWGTLQFPVPFWRWWTKQHQAGADAILISCEDGEAGKYVARGVRTDALDPQAVTSANALLREAAVDAIKGTRGIQTDQLPYRLLARGVYHTETAPDPVSRVLFGSDGQFVTEGWTTTYRPDLTPAMRRLFGHRIETWSLEEEILRELLGLPALAEPQYEGELETDIADDVGLEAKSEIPAQMGYRLKVSLAWMPDVWRVVEMLDNQTLEDLHYEIQDAFHWDDDHLYAFFLSGRAWDNITEVDRPEMNTEAEAPLADEVTLAALELKPGQSFLYIFDFGDELRHKIEVLGTFPLPARGKFPRIAERHGKAPPQYGRWDEEEVS